MNEHEDMLQDQEQIDESIEPVTEDLENHEDSDKSKWKDVFGRLDNLAQRLDDFEKWVNEAIGGVDKTEAESAEASAYGDKEENEEVADLDRAFYERQKQYLSEGGF